MVDILMALETNLWTNWTKFFWGHHIVAIDMP